MADTKRVLTTSGNNIYSNGTLVGQYKNQNEVQAALNDYLTVPGNIMGDAEGKVYRQTFNKQSPAELQQAANQAQDAMNTGLRTFADSNYVAGDAARSLIRGGLQPLPNPQSPVPAPSFVPLAENPVQNTQNLRYNDSLVKTNGETVLDSIDNATKTMTNSLIGGATGINDANYTAFQDSAAGQKAQAAIDAVQAEIDKVRAGDYSTQQLDEIQAAVKRAQDQYAPLIKEAEAAREHGLPKAIVQSGEAGGLMNTQFAGVAALLPTKGNTFVGAGGELERIQSTYDRNIDNLKTQAQQAMAEARVNAEIAIKTGNQQDLDNARAAYEQARKSHNEALSLAQEREDKIASFKANADKQMASTIQASQEGAILGLYQQGVTDPAKIFDYVNYDEQGNLIGDITFKQVTDVVSALQKAKSNPSEYATIGGPGEGFYELRKDPNTGQIIDYKEIISPKTAADTAKPLSKDDLKYWEDKGYSVHPGTTLEDLKAQGAPVDTTFRPSASYEKTVDFGISALAPHLAEAKFNATKENIEGLLKNGEVGKARESLFSAALAALPAADKSANVGRRNSIKSLDAIQEKIDKYVAAGGKMNLLSGTQQEINEKLGRTGDKELAQLGTDIAATLFDYRHSQTGAAFSQQETDAYKLLFPLIGNEPALNAARISSLKETFNRSLDTALSSYLGEGTYDELQNLEKNTYEEMYPDGSWDSFVSKAGGEAKAKKLILDSLYKEDQSFNNVPSKTENGSVGNITLGSHLAQVNNNPGNLRFAGQPGASQGSGGFAKFSTPQAGFQALLGQISLDAGRGHTLKSFINKYAPPSENDTGLYVKQIAKAVGASEGTLLKDIDLLTLGKAMALKESSSKIG